ncbi:MAG: adenylosuccinate synthase [Candidatus Cloacimonetes bacterium]|jgi:adenylosuccinate synthase|nr:adenylosuccinate synthase [Candidatus Cloacimonadota bacterium]HOQ77740.1 adenylosuccinate synthase [Candidatus Cloacimonas sp.]MDD4676595.1 adenylosuccinate synthase [Candidatus Cloacimonadota bacterium]HPH72352.1 adenylosuccinate synthase [Candidatus Cloacimonas sp.]HPN26310.1 adenylosuccinate synthase [Candidatus Cloacimonas sp.]
MASTLVLGCMWGDEGKAKIVDYLAASADFVVRFQGGSNAGHTIVYGNQKYVLHTIPSGILYPDTTCLIGAGVLVDPTLIKEEIHNLEKANIDFSKRLLIDYRAGVVLPLHKQLDMENETKLKKSKIGTTGKGIGPAYSDLTARIGIRLEDLAYPEYLSERLKQLYTYHHKKLTDAELTKQIAELQDSWKFLKKYTGDVESILNDIANIKDKSILFEGAQGTLLDLNFGTYPYVTSSRVMTDAAGIGTGFSARRIDKVLGIYKAYTTRVGEGPFPTEIFTDIADRIRTAGNEYGSTTGRPRRIGWFDGVAARYSARINALDNAVITCLDVLQGLDELKICSAYKYKGKLYRSMKLHPSQFDKIEPVYESFEGWDADICNCKNKSELPKAARDYLEAIEDFLETRICLVSVGREREQTFTIKERKR